MDTIKIQLSFSEETKYGTYNDSLYFTEEEYKQATLESIAALKQERVDKWIKVLTTPPPIVELTDEEIQQQLQQIEEQKVALDTTKSELEAQLLT